MSGEEEGERKRDRSEEKRERKGKIVKERKKERRWEREKFGLINLFNRISTPYGLFNAKIFIHFGMFDYDRGEEEKDEKRKERKIYLDLVWLIFLTAYQLLQLIYHRLYRTGSKYAACTP